MMYRLLVIALLFGNALSFTQSRTPEDIATLPTGRRAFLDISLTTGVSALIGISQPAFAESTSDLSMPTDEEQQVS